MVSLIDKIDEVELGLPSVEQTVIVPYPREELKEAKSPSIGGRENWDTFLQNIAPQRLTFLPTILIILGTCSTPQEQLENPNA